jgi:hypothetical protein
VKRSQPSHRGGDSAVLSARTGPRTRVDADARRTVACCGDEYRRHISEEAPTDHVRVEHALSRVDEFSVRCAVHDREPTREPRLTLQQRWRPERHPLAARRGTEFGANLQMLDGPVSVRECGIPVREGSNWWRYRHLCAVMMVLVPSECARPGTGAAPGRAGSGGGMGAQSPRHAGQLLGQLPQATGRLGVEGLRGGGVGGGVAPGYAGTRLGRCRCRRGYPRWRRRGSGAPPWCRSLRRAGWRRPRRSWRSGWPCVPAGGGGVAGMGGYSPDRRSRIGEASLEFEDEEQVGQLGPGLRTQPRFKQVLICRLRSSGQFMLRPTIATLSGVRVG